MPPAKLSKAKRYANLPDWAKPPAGQPAPKPVKHPPSNPSGVSPATSATPIAPKKAKAPKSTGSGSSGYSGGGGTVRITTQSSGGSSGAVLILATALFVMTFYKAVFSQLIAASWNGSKISISLQTWGAFLAGAAFVGILGFLASIEQLSGLILLIVIGLWMVYLVEQGTGNISGLFDFFNNQTSLGSGLNNTSKTSTSSNQTFLAYVPGNTSTSNIQNAASATKGS